MRPTVFRTFAVATLSALVTSPAFAGLALGQPLGTELSAALGVTLPAGTSGLLGLAAAGVVAGVWLAKRKR